GMILRQVAGHADQPGPRIEDLFPRFPLLPQTKKRFLCDVECCICVHPARIGERPDLPAVPLVEGLELGPQGVWRRWTRVYMSLYHLPAPAARGETARQSNKLTRQRSIPNLFCVTPAGGAGGTRASGSAPVHTSTGGSRPPLAAVTPQPPDYHGG